MTPPPDPLRAPSSPLSGPASESGRLDDRLGRNAAALVVGALVTSGLGFAFWVLGARLLDEGDLGIASGLIAAVVLLGNAATLGLRNALQRFLPESGDAARRFVVRAYLGAVVAGLLLGTGFVAVSAWLVPDLPMIRTGIAGPALFVGSVATWAVFVLQDNVLIGLRRATWVPVENLVYAMAKLLLLLAVASWTPWGLLVAWSAPALAVIGPLNWGIFTRLVPRRAGRAGAATSTLPPFRLVARFAGGDHLADTLTYLGAEGVVLVVLAKLGPEATAPLFVALTIAAALRVLGSNVMSAFLAEAAARPADADELLWRSFLRVALVVAPAAVVGTLAAPLVLWAFGGQYGETATTVLRLFLLGAIAGAVIDVYISWLRFHRQMRRLVGLAALGALGPLVAALVLSDLLGIAAVGWGLLVGHGLLAAAILRGPLRPVLLVRLRRELIGHAARLRTAVRQRRRIRAAATLLDELDVGRTGDDVLLPRTFVPTETDVAVAVVGGGRDVVVKVALSRQGGEGLDAHRVAVEAMRAATESSSSLRLMPEMVEVGTVMGQRYVVETALPGSTGDGTDAATMSAAAAAVTALHRATVRPLQRFDHIGYHVVYTPMRVVMEAPAVGSDRQRIADVGDVLERALIAQPVLTARTHGDFWLGNVLFDDESPMPVVSGVIDWENSVEIGLPEIDLAHLWLSIHPGGLAGGVADAMGPGRFVDLAGPCGFGAINTELRAALVVPLAWLAHVADGIGRSSRFALGSHWYAENVTAVLDVLEAHDLPSLLAPGSPAVAVP